MSNELIIQTDKLKLIDFFHALTLKGQFCLSMYLCILVPIAVPVVIPIPVLIAVPEILIPTI